MTTDITIRIVVLRNADEGRSAVVGLADHLEFAAREYVQRNPIIAFPRRDEVVKAEIIDR